MTISPSSSEERKERGKTVCVVDASTYVGLWIVKGLVLRGYTVHAAFQNGATESETARKLQEMGRANEGVKIFAADVLDYHSIIDALQGCSGIFYTFDQSENSDGYDERMVEIEVRGAHNVLEACAQTQSIEKVVFTSSVCAAVWREDRNATDDHFEERHWSDANFCRKIKLWYALAKTLSEKTAWALAMDRGVNMVTINAALIVGPAFSNQNSGSTISYLKGAAQMYEDGVLASVDVRYLADAHICAFEDPSAFGRYICFNQIVNNAQHALNLAQCLRPLISLPER
eukprot:Gb_01297 [translate_table: standard]